MTYQVSSPMVISALNDLLPAMEADGGGAEFVSLEDGNLTVRLLGTCLFCPSRKLSAAALDRGLRSRVPGLRTVHILYPETTQVPAAIEMLFQLPSADCVSR